MDRAPLTRSRSAQLGGKRGTLFLFRPKYEYLWARGWHRYSHRALLFSQAGNDLIDLNALIQAAECLKVLAHPHRLRIVELLLQRRYTVGELAEVCAIPSNVASGHLKLLERCGLLGHRREGRRIYYRVAESCLKDIIACIRKRFASK